jgi:hypothetical protein
VTRVLVTRHHFHDPKGGGWDTSDVGGNGDRGNGSGDSSEAGGAGGLAARLQAARRLLPPALGGPPTQPLEVGRTTRTVAPAQRNALVVRDGGCVFPGCDRPQDWCEAHHLRHWLHGGPTDLANLALLCRAHHRGGPRGRLAAGSRPGRAIHRHPTPPPTTTQRRLRRYPAAVRRASCDEDIPDPAAAEAALEDVMTSRGGRGRAIAQHQQSPPLLHDLAAESRSRLEEPP